MSGTKIRGSNQIKPKSITVDQLQENFLQGITWNVSTDNTARISGIADPTSPSEVANKHYVDQKIGSGGGSGGGTSSGYASMLRNLIINGDFQVWQRGKSFTINNNSMYTADRWMVDTQSESKVLRGELDASQSTVDLCDLFGDGSGIATYQFDGNSNDLCGNYNGTWSGNEQYDAGKFSQAAKFDGSSYVTIPSPSKSLPISISLWFKTTQKAHGSADWHNPTLIGFGTPGANSNDFGIEIKNGYIGTFLGFGVEDYYYSNTFVSDGKWHNVVLTLHPHLATVYLDGNKLYERNINSNTIDNVPQWWIGVMYHAGIQSDSYFRGLIDQVRIFNRVLAEDEVIQLYHEDYQVISNNGATHRISATPDYSTEYIKPFVYRFEGQHLYNQAYQGNKLTLSFDFKSNKTGKYSVALINKTDSSNIQSVIKTFTYTTANITERKTITFNIFAFTAPIRDDNQLGFELVFFGMTNISSLIGQPDIVQSGEKITTADTVRLEENDQIWINKVQLEEGNAATNFARLHPQLTHLLCRRYYQIKDTESTLTLFPLMRTDNPTISGSGPYYFDAEL